MSVTVTDGLAIVKDRDLDFGTVASASGPTSLGLADPAIAVLRIVGSQNRQVTVTLTPPAALANGAATIPYTWAGAYNESINTPTAATTVAFSGTTSTFRLRDTSLSRKYGQAYLYLYGQIDVGSVPPGSYSATFTVSAAY